MPLKHLTETILVLLLAVAILVTGVIVAVLPPLPVGIGLWGIAFVVSLLYPLLLHPLLRESRADQSFRLLHAFPAALLGTWLVVQILTSLTPGFGWLSSLLTWGWGLAPVALGFFLLLGFCLQVIRQWTTRAIALLTILLSFVTLGLIGEGLQWPAQLSARLAGQSVAQQSSSASSGPRQAVVAVASSSAVSPRAVTSLAALSRSSASSLASSVRSVSSHASARGQSSAVTSAASSSARPGLLARLWASVVGEEGATSSESSAPSSASSSSLVVVQSSSVSVSSRSSAKPVVPSSPVAFRSSSSARPPHLATSGLGLGELGVLLGAAYTAVLHARARRRR